MDYFNAFWVGGLICALVQILLDKTKLMPGRVMVLLVCTGSILGAIGIYQPLIDFAGAGAAVASGAAFSSEETFISCNTCSIIAFKSFASMELSPPSLSHEYRRVACKLGQFTIL